MPSAELESKVEPPVGSSATPRSEADAKPSGTQPPGGDVKADAPATEPPNAPASSALPAGDIAAPQKSSSDDSSLAVTPSTAVETEVLPAEKKEEPPKKIFLFVMRALRGKQQDEDTDKSLAARPATEIAPSLHGGAPPRRPPFWRRHALFLASVVVPVFLSILFFGFYATDIYVSESSYVVRSPNKQSASVGGLGAILEGAGFSGFAKAPDDVYAVTQYIRSRDALKYLDGQLDLRAAWGNREIDLFHRFDPLGRDNSQEALYEYYLKRLKVGAEPASGITTLNVSGFKPEEVLKMNQLLLGKAEELVNTLNERGRNDLIRFAEKEVNLAEDKAKAAAHALSDYRNTEAVVDPEKQTMLHFEQVARLQEELIRTRGQLTQLKVFAPDSPHPPALELRAQTLETEIAAETEKITGGENSLASKAAEYQRLQLEREFADKQLAVAMSSLEGARNEAQRQQLYLETIAKPSLPDDATYPKRPRGVITTLILGLVAWGILAMLLAGVREHQY